LAAPYVNVQWRVVDAGLMRVEWELGGCIHVDHTWIEMSVRGQTYNSTVQSGGCLWGNHTTFTEDIRMAEDLEFVVVGVVDQAWSEQVNPDPPTKPQSLLVQSRTNPSFKVTNKAFSLAYNGRVRSRRMIGYLRL
jgi:hypothetical protein